LTIPEYAKRLGADIDRNGVTIVEVGGKRNIIDFVELALSLKIPVGFVYDIDSSDFHKNQKGEELKYNSVLEGYSTRGVSVFHFSKNYEEELKNEFGDEEYQGFCNKYGGYSKAVRARLFAIDVDISIPKIVLPIIDWLGKIN